ncbi:MAG: reverse transcriptase domain-containing protein, partial [Pseudomonadota bacterium]
CTPYEFREKIVKGGLVQKHTNTYGIPQGTPISDLLANAFLFDFDVQMKTYAESKNGTYFRYSDDILLILPGNGKAAYAAFVKARREINNIGTELILKEQKTEIVCFTPKNTIHRCYSLKLSADSYEQEKYSPNDGLSYLGFRYDGRNVYLRNSTITTLRGKIARTCKATAFNHVRKHKNKSVDWLLERSPVGKVKQQFLNVKDFDPLVAKAVNSGNSPFKLMTFLSYAKRARAIFGKKGKPILKQLRNINSDIETKLHKEIRSKAYAETLNVTRNRNIKI